MVATERPILSLADLEAFDPHAPAGGRERRFTCPLPACADKPKGPSHRSLSLNVATGEWTCYRCSAGGQLREHWQTRNRQADVRRAFGLPPVSAGATQNSGKTVAAATPASASSTPVEPQKTRAGEDWREVLQNAQDLNGNARALEYLSRRGLSRPMAIGNDVAYSPSWYGRPAVLFPIRDRAGELVAMQGRYIDGRDTPKARTAGELKLGVFKTLEALDTETMVITEAPLDALSLAAVGVPAIALCGTNAPSWLPQTAAFRRVALAFDADTAGQDASDKLATLLRSFGAVVTRWAPPRKDWNAVLLEDGADALRRWLAGQSAS